MPKPQPDEIRLLAPSGRRSDPLGYTDVPGLAMRDEPEAISRDDYERHVLGRAQTAAEQQAAIEAARMDQQRRLLTAEERMSAAHQEARRRCIDVSSEVRLLNSMLSNGKQARHVERQLGAMERKVYREAA